MSMTTDPAMIPRRWWSQSRPPVFKDVIKILKKARSSSRRKSANLQARPHEAKMDDKFDT